MSGHNYVVFDMLLYHIQAWRAVTACRLELEQLQARLSNPLLRQAAPFEF